MSETTLEQRLQKYFEQLLAHLGVNTPEIAVSVDNDLVTVQLTVPSEESGILIGHHGESLYSMQKVAATSLQEYLEDKKIVLNVNNYKQTRETQLTQMAEQAAAKVVQSGRAQTLPYLPAHERLVVHTVLANNKQVVTQSEGEGNSRRLSILPAANES